jgi:hypothetical protein
MGEEILGEPYQRRIASKIIDIIDKGLQTCPRLKSRKSIIERVLSSTTVATNMPNSFLPPKVVITTQELIVGMHISLVDTKQVNSNVKLVVKHCILTTLISAGPSFVRGIVQILGVHHRNICANIVRRTLMCDSGVPSWTLTLKNKRSDGILLSTRNAIVDWRAAKFRVSPNKSDVICKKLEVGIFDEKSTHFLMET